MTLSDLLGKLEEASEGSRDLDACIWVTLGLSPAKERQYYRWCSMRPKGDGVQSRHVFALHAAPDFTTSLDAALTLVPDLCEVHLNIYGGPARATAYFDGGEYVESDDKPAAMALVIVALKARQAMASRGDK